MIKTAVERIITILEETDLIRHVQFSDPDEFLNKKTNFYPAALVNVVNVDINDISLDMSFNVIIADELDGGKSELDSLSLTMAAIGRLVIVLQRLSEAEDVQMTLDSISPAERVYESGTTNYYGWSISFVIQTPNVYHNG